MRLRVRARETEPERRASFLVLRLHSAPRQVCLAQGGDVLGRRDGVAWIVEIRRSYFSRAAADAIRQQVLGFTHYRRSDPSIDEYVVEFGLLRGKAES